MKAIALVAIAGCSQAASTRSTLTLRTACPETQHWDGSTCKPSGDGAQRVALGSQALAELKIEEAKAALDSVDQAGPLDHKSNVTLWEQRGIAAAYADDEATASTAFDMLLALDPTHFLSYELSTRATLVFEKTLKQTKARPAPAIDVNWERGQKVGDPVSLDVEVLADPKQFLNRATLFVRTRGEPGWRAADVALENKLGERRIVLPPIEAAKPVSLELYLRAYDDRGNEVLTWADPNRPREIALRYDPPTPWYRTWWGITTIGVVGAAVVGTIVYAVTLSPPDKIDGDVTVR